MAWRRMIIWGGFGLAIALGLAYAFKPRPVLVDMVVLERGPMMVTFDEEGETRVRVVLWEDDDALRLPLTALFRDGECWAVFVEEDGRTRLRHVEIGHRNGLDAEIVSSVDAGMNVVRHPSDQVSDGVLIEERT